MATWLSGIASIVPSVASAVSWVRNRFLALDEESLLVSPLIGVVICQFVVFLVSLLASAEVFAQTVYINSGDNVQRVVNNRPENTYFVLRAGVYRMQSIVPKNGDIFDGSAGAVLNGSRLLTSFTKSGNAWVATGQTQQGHRNAGASCLPGHPRCAYPEDLYINDIPKLHVASRSAVGPGKWYFDYAADTVYIGDGPAGKKVEISVTPRAFGGSAANVTIKNLIIKKYASPLQEGTIDAHSGNNWIIEGNTIHLNHGYGVYAGPGSKVLQNKINLNGHAGYGSGGSNNFLFERNEIARNNYAGVDPEWEAGGGKVAETSEGVVFRSNCVHDNDGPGIWMDIDANNVLVENNVVFRNSVNGIQYEISYNGIIRNNIVADNGWTKDWFWSPQILISSSRGVKVYGNTVDVPAEYGNAITIVSQDRPPYTPAINNEVYGNTVTIRGTNGGRLGAITDVSGDVATVARYNSMRNNTYHLANLSEDYWTWNDRDLNWNGIRSARQEAGSTADTNLPPKPALNCAFMN